MSKRAKRDTEPIPAQQRDLAAHDAVVMEALQIIVWLLALILALGVVSLFIGCARPNVVGDAGFTWYSNRWKNVPILVSWDREEFPAHYSDAIELAMGEFPCGMFAEWTSGRGPDVTIEVYEGQKACGGVEFSSVDFAGITYHCDGWAEIYLAGDALAYDPTEAYLVALHELGHAAGLAHDPRQSLVRYINGMAIAPAFVSVMVPDVLAQANRLSAGFMLPMLTQHDWDLMERRFCR